MSIGWRDRDRGAEGARSGSGFGPPREGLPSEGGEERLHPRMNFLISDKIIGLRIRHYFYVTTWLHKSV